MSASLSASLFTILNTAVLLVVIFRAARLIESSGRSMTAVFFTFAAVSLLVSNLYWIAYDLMRPGTRMPFAANELGEWAAFLLLSTSLLCALRERFGEAGKEMLCAGAFVAASTVLWIAWSGEWAQDILTGVAFGYLVCTAVRAMKLANALARWEWRALGLGAGLLILVQSAIFFVPRQMKLPLDLICYALMYLGILFFFGKVIREGRQAARPDALLALSFGGYAWGISSLYMSEGYFYLGAFLSIIVIQLFMLHAVRREVEAA